MGEHQVGLRVDHLLHVPWRLVLPARTGDEEIAAVVAV
jgi:hypothetical protein